MKKIFPCVTIFEEVHQSIPVSTSNAEITEVEEPDQESERGIEESDKDPISDHEYDSYDYVGPGCT